MKEKISNPWKNTTYKLDRTFGPFGASTGFFMTIGGIFMMYYSMWGIIAILIGAFVGLTSTSTIIDWNNKRIKYSNNFFGIFKTGPWISIEPDMKLGIRKSSKKWQAYSRSNMPLSLAFQDYRISLYSANNKIIVPIMKTKTYDAAKKEASILSSRLGLDLA